MKQKTESGENFFIGIDVGTGSARAGVFTSTGRRLTSAAHAIRMWQEDGVFAEQSSEDIWRACCRCVRDVLRETEIAPAAIGGIGFDATCSLVALDEQDRPVTVSREGADEQNVIVWMDHRAIRQAERVNALGHDVLRYVGGVISPEMQTPKLMWLKEHLPETWRRARRFLDLPDFLVYRATGEDVRSLCTTVCKWTYLGHETGEDGQQGRWDSGFFNEIGLDDLVTENFSRIGTRVRPMGEAVGSGLSPAAASDLGLAAGTSVSVGIIDAHAGGIGCLGVGGESLDAAAFSKRLALIGGTSSCHMAVSEGPRFIEGVWGPYFSAMVPGFWLTEGGQSATGSLIDHMVFSHPAAAEVREKAEKTGETVYQILNSRLAQLGEDLSHRALLTRDLHVSPYFHGNRSPRADSTLKGMISGLTLSNGPDDLAVLYLATIQAVAYGTRHIVEAMNRAGYQIDTIAACGGGTKNPVFLQEHADITGCRIVLPEEPEAVLLGAALLGAVAGGAFASIPEAMAAMTRSGQSVEPRGGDVASYHEAKYSVFHRLYDDQMAYRRAMAQGSLDEGSAAITSK